MTAEWHDDECQRPDPYLDWEYRTRPPQSTVYWCSVHVRVLQDANGDYLPNLSELLAAVSVGRLDGDPGGPSDLTIRMTDDERAFLQTFIDEVGHGYKPTDQVETQFFIYRLESLIYLDGRYASTPLYTTLYAGPPIPALTFNPPTSKPTQFPQNPTAAKRIAVGIVDDGIAFAHKRFRASDGSSRVHAVWLQEAEQATSNEGVSLGKLLDYREIDRLVASGCSESDIYRQAGATDFGRKPYNPLAARATHGTHVLDLAAGYDPPKGKLERPILAVQLPSAATIDTSGMTMGSYVLQAVRMIMVWADALAGSRFVPLPLVINFSYGILAGPKDGTQYLEAALADLVDHRNRTNRPTWLVVPAGNSYRERAAAKVELAADAGQNLDWVVLPDDGAPNYLEIWFDERAGAGAPSSVEVALTPPGEATCTPVRLQEGTMRVLKDRAGRAIAGIYYDISTATSRARVFLAVAPTVRNDQDWALAPSGRWKVTIRATTNALTAHYYVQRDDTPFGYPRKGRQSHLDHPKAYWRDPKTGDYRIQEPDCPIIYQETLSAIATSRSFVVVGGVEACDGDPPTDYTSSGPTPSRRGPDCSAVADDGDAQWGMLAAGTFSGSFVRMNGTSVAAPQVARQIAEQQAGVTPPTSPVAPTNLAQLGAYVVPLTEIPAHIRRRYPAG